jgi:hypothetical protein
VRKIVLTFGLISGAILSVMMLLTMLFKDRIGFDRAAVIGYSTMVLAFLMIFVGVKSYRDNVAGGSVSFGRAFQVGLLILIVATVCYVATWQVIYYKVAPDFGEKFAAYQVEKVKQSGAPEAEIARQIREVEDFQVRYRNPLVNIAWTFIEPMPVGLLFALIAAGALSRKRRPATA